MAHYWLVPLTSEDGAWVLGAERLPLEPDGQRERFTAQLQQAHPRLLLSFKAHLLVAEEGLDACGIAVGDCFALAEPGPVRLIPEAEGWPAGAEEWPLSHCGEAYIDRLLDGSAAAALLGGVSPEPEAAAWLEAMRCWLREGKQAILLRED